MSLQNPTNVRDIQCRLFLLLITVVLGARNTVLLVSRVYAATQCPTVIGINLANIRLRDAKQHGLSNVVQHIMNHILYHNQWTIDRDDRRWALRLPGNNSRGKNEKGRAS